MKYIPVLVKFHYFLSCMYGLHYPLLYCGLTCLIKGVLYLGLFSTNYFMTVASGLLNVNNFVFLSFTFEGSVQVHITMNRQCEMTTKQLKAFLL